MSTSAATTTSDFMFKTNNNAQKMNYHQRQHFYTTVARGIFLTKRARPDIHTAIVYLYKRVKDTNTNYCNKLSCMVMYLLVTNELFLRIKV